MNTKLLLGATALVALLTAANAAPDQPGHAKPTPGTANDTLSTLTDAAGHAVGTVDAATTTTLQGFVEAAAISDMYEVEAARIALKRSQNPEVKDFAQKMIEAHTGTTNALKLILVKLPSSPAAPAHVDNRRQGMLDELRGAKAVDFDGRYLSQQVDAHNEALLLMRGYAKNGDNPAVKAFAEKTATPVAEHLGMAHGLYDKYGRSS
ncbi:MAG: DUF4142 domain-containing protein [Rhizomicrobium sp.]